METRTFFKLEININELDDFFPSEKKCSKNYKTELIIDETNDNTIQLKIFFDQKENLGEKLVNWSKPNDFNLIKYFKVTEVIKPKSLLEIDFLNYRCKGMKTSFDFYEFDLKYIVINLSGVKKIYSNSEKSPSIIYLNQQSFGLIELNYDYNQHFPFGDEEYKWKPINKIKDYIKFGNISFKPEHEFINSTENYLEKISISKKPRLTIKYDNNLNESEAKKHIELICSIYSFYSSENIDYSLSKIYTEDKLHIEIRDISNSIPKNYHGIFRWELSQNPLNLLINIDTKLLLENLTFFKKLTERYIYSLNTSGESKFMILYSILEEIRNKYILDNKIETAKAGIKPNIKRVTEEYNFTLSNTRTDKFIKETLEKITTIISDEDKELFMNEIKYKLKPIKVVSMINQFKSFFDFIQIDPEEFDLDFIKLKNLRNSIFHGIPINKDLETLHQINLHKRLPKFVGTIILKYSRIDDLNNIELFKTNDEQFT